MIRSTHFTIAAAATLLVALGAGSAVQAAPMGAKCVLAGGEANMITQGLAEFMAKAALKNSINGMGAKPAGVVALKCNQNGALQYCKATQRACK
jgi:hypothetical protein